MRFEETGHARVAKVGVAEDVPGAVDGGIGQVEAIGPGDSLKEQEKLLKQRSRISHYSKSEP